MIRELRKRRHELTRQTAICLLRFLFRRICYLVNWLPLLWIGTTVALLYVIHLTLYHPRFKMAASFHYHTFDVFMFSAWYFNTSRSLGENAVAIVFAGDRSIFDTIGRVTIFGWNDAGENAMTTVPVERIIPHVVCFWSAFVAIGNLVPNMTRLAVGLGNKYKEVPFRPVRRQRREVVSCVAPLFASEQWQPFIVGAHVNRRFGSHIHLYVRSAVESVFDLLREYEKEGYITIQPWLKIHLPEVPTAGFNPNVNVEFRNQAAAQTDCLLQYKESARFIAFMDLDELIIPRLAPRQPGLAISYAAEYEFLYEENPLVATLHYIKENTKVFAHESPEYFSPVHLFSSVEFLKRKETGKFVTRPDYINHTWMHFPTVWPYGFDRKYTVPTDRNCIVHLKTVINDNTTDPEPTELKESPYNPTAVKNPKQPVISIRDLEAIQMDYERMHTKLIEAGIITRLPLKYPYMELIGKCYYETYYRFHYGGGIVTCPGPDRCKLPVKPGINCTNAVNTVVRAGGSVYNWHYPENIEFIVEDGCR